MQPGGNLIVRDAGPDVIQKETKTIVVTRTSLISAMTEEQEGLCTFDSTYPGGAEMDNPYKHLQNAFQEPLPESPIYPLNVDSPYIVDSFGSPLPDSFTLDRFAWLDTDKFVEKKLKEQEENKEKPDGREDDDHDDSAYDNDSLGG